MNKEVSMLFDIEQKIVSRCTIEESPVCEGCLYLGLDRGEERFCIMQQHPECCVVAKATGRFERTAEDRS